MHISLFLHNISSLLHDGPAERKFDNDSQTIEWSFIILSRLEIRIHDRHTLLGPAIPYEAAKSYSWKPGDWTGKGTTEEGGGKATNCIHVIALAWACNGYHTSTCICMECISLLTEFWGPVFHWQWDTWKGRYLYAKLMCKAPKPNTLSEYIMTFEDIDELSLQY